MSLEGQILFHWVNGVQVMLDRDLAELYGVETKQLNRAVKRNIERFPKEFMFQLIKEEFENLKFHFGTSSWGGVRKLPFVFTEQGVSMLSAVLKSKKIKVTIFTKEISKKMKLDLEKYNSQYAPIEIKQFKNSHDRFLIIDNKTVFHFGASLKDLGKKWFGFNKFEIDAIDMLKKLK